MITTRARFERLSEQDFRCRWRVQVVPVPRGVEAAVLALVPAAVLAVGHVAVVSGLLVTARAPHLLPCESGALQRSTVPL